MSCFECFQEFEFEFCRNIMLIPPVLDFVTLYIDIGSKYYIDNGSISANMHVPDKHLKVHIAGPKSQNGSFSEFCVSVIV